MFFVANIGTLFLFITKYSQNDNQKYNKKYDIKLQIYYFNTRKTPQHINAEGYMIRELFL